MNLVLDESVEYLRGNLKAGVGTVLLSWTGAGFHALQAAKHAGSSYMQHAELGCYA